MDDMTQLFFTNDMVTQELKVMRIEQLFLKNASCQELL